jgi:hypothetical protein
MVLTKSSIESTLLFISIALTALHYRFLHILVSLVLRQAIMNSSANEAVPEPAQFGATSPHEAGGLGARTAIVWSALQEVECLMTLRYR